MNTCTSFFTYSVDGDDRFQADLRVEPVTDGIELLHITLDTAQAVEPKPVVLHYTHSLLGVNGIWTPNADATRTVLPRWAQPKETCSTVNAPVMCFFGGNHNRLTVAASDAMNVLSFYAGVDERTSLSYSKITFFAKPTPALAHYEVSIRFDRCDVPYYDALGDVTKWWETLEGYAPSPVPEYARLPMYSTWYSFLQNITAADIERQCAIAKTLGCESVITDDGWQFEVIQKGYGHCGDWQICEKKMGDMAAHVQRVHDLGMKYLMWYSVPYIGWFADCYPQYKDRTLSTLDYWECDVLDPRYKEIREYLIGTYENAAKSFGLDGFKLDFVDQFLQPKAKDEKPDLGRDEVSVPMAVDKLLTGVMERLRALNPDVMIEFRQRYIGPLMRKYGNMFRATDCPSDASMNHVRTVDVRLLCGDSATHADMIHWHPDESAQTAALSIIAALFSVPQISVLLDQVPQEHLRMIKFYLTFWKEHRDLLLDSHFRPLYPDRLYPLVMGDAGNRLLAAIYADTVVTVEHDRDEIILVNGGYDDGIVVDFGNGNADYEAVHQDCLGEVVGKFDVSGRGCVRLPLVSAGVLTLRKKTK